GNPTGSTTSGVPMNVDYVRVYYANSGPTNTPGGPTNTPTKTSTPGSTATTSGSGFTQGMTTVNSSTALSWFQPSGWTAGYVILHYIVAGQTQQNVNMTYNTGTARWEYSIG